MDGVPPLIHLAIDIGPQKYINTFLVLPNSFGPPLGPPKPIRSSKNSVGPPTILAAVVNFKDRGGELLAKPGLFCCLLGRRR